jgi:hypothetical protein
MNVGAWLMNVLIIETFAIGCVAYLAFTGFFVPMRLLAKVGILMMTAGLVVQITRTLHFFEFGAYPVDSIFPLWVTKDIGASLVIFDLMLLSRQMRLAAKQPSP